MVVGDLNLSSELSVIYTQGTVKYSDKNTPGVIKVGYTDSDNNHAVKLDKNGRAYVTVNDTGKIYTGKNGISVDNSANNISLTANLSNIAGYENIKDIVSSQLSDYALKTHTHTISDLNGNLSCDRVEGLGDLATKDESSLGLNKYLDKNATDTPSWLCSKIGLSDYITKTIADNTYSLSSHTHVSSDIIDLDVYTKTETDNLFSSYTKTIDFGDLAFKDETDLSVKKYTFNSGLSTNIDENNITVAVKVDNKTIGVTEDGICAKYKSGDGINISEKDNEQIINVKVDDKTIKVLDGKLSCVGGGGEISIEATEPLYIKDNIISLAIDNNSLTTDFDIEVGGKTLRALIPTIDAGDGLYSEKDNTNQYHISVLIDDDTLEWKLAEMGENQRIKVKYGNSLTSSEGGLNINIKENGGLAIDNDGVYVKTDDDTIIVTEDGKLSAKLYLDLDAYGDDYISAEVIGQTIFVGAQDKLKSKFNSISEISVIVDTLSDNFDTLSGIVEGLSNVVGDGMLSYLDIDTSSILTEEQKKQLFETYTPLSDNNKVTWKLPGLSSSNGILTSYNVTEDRLYYAIGLDNNVLTIDKETSSLTISASVMLSVENFFDTTNNQLSLYLSSMSLHSPLYINNDSNTEIVINNLSVTNLNAQLEKADIKTLIANGSDVSVCLGDPYHWGGLQISGSPYHSETESYGYCAVAGLNELSIRVIESIEDTGMYFTDDIVYTKQTVNVEYEHGVSYKNDLYITKGSFAERNKVHLVVDDIALADDYEKKIVMDATKLSAVVENIVLSSNNNISLTAKDNDGNDIGINIGKINKVTTKEIETDILCVNCNPESIGFRIGDEYSHNFIKGNNNSIYTCLSGLSVMYNYEWDDYNHAVDINSDHIRFKTYYGQYKINFQNSSEPSGVSLDINAKNIETESFKLKVKETELSNTEIILYDDEWQKTNYKMEKLTVGDKEILAFVKQ